MTSLGVLALQGGFAAHAAAFAEIGVPAREVRRVAELAGLAGLVIPGGESTTLLNLMRDEPWFEAITAFHGAGGVVAGTCAGAILLAREVRPRQPSLALLDAVVERNAWGRQVDSFEARLDAPALGGTLDGVFIRAPRFRALFPDVEVLARHAGEPVLVRQGRVVAATFHPELTRSRSLHRYIAGLAGYRSASLARIPAVQDDLLRQVDCAHTPPEELVGVSHQVEALQCDLGHPTLPPRSATHPG